MHRIAIIRFWYEGSAFSPAIARREDFLSREWISGAAAKQFYTGQALETGACVDFLAAHPQVHGDFVFCAAAYPAGPIEAGLGAEILQRVETGLADQHWDGVYLSLHGSSVFEDQDNFEISLLECARKHAGAVPIAASFDLHANLDPAIAQLVDILCGYKTYPHIDMYATGMRAMSLLYQTVVGEICPLSQILPVEFVPTSFNMRTEAGPMAQITQAAVREELRQQFFDISAFGGFIYADSPHAGASISVCCERKGAGSALNSVQQLVNLYRKLAPEFDVQLPDPDTVLSRLADTETGRRIAVLEPSDNPFSGGVGDTPGLLKAVLEKSADVPSVFAFFCDPDLVQTAHTAGVGAALECCFGARLANYYGQPVKAKAVVETLTQGNFHNLGPMDTHLPVALGATAVVCVNQVKIILTSKNVPVNDSGYFQLHGLDLDTVGRLYVKAKNHFRAAFGNKFEQILEVETAGPAQANISALPFRNIPVQRLGFGRKLTVREDLS